MPFPKPIPSTLIRERLRYNGLKFTLLSQELQFPNGVTGERQYIEHPGGAMVIPVTAAGKYLCIRQYRFAIANYIYEFPAGTLEPSEAPDVTIKRELAEETGYQATQWDDLGPIYLAPGYSDEVLYTYLARGLSQLPHPPAGDDDEDIEVVEFTAAELTERILYTHEIDVKTIAGFFKAQQFLNRP